MNTHKQIRIHCIHIDLVRKRPVKHQTLSNQELQLILLRLNPVELRPRTASDDDGDGVTVLLDFGRDAVDRVPALLELDEGIFELLNTGMLHLMLGDTETAGVEVEVGAGVGVGVGVGVEVEVVVTVTVTGGGGGPDTVTVATVVWVVV